MPLTVSADRDQDLNPRVVAVIVVLLMACLLSVVWFSVAGVASYQAVSGVLAGL